MATPKATAIQRDSKKKKRNSHSKHLTLFIRNLLNLIALQRKFMWNIKVAVNNSEAHVFFKTQFNLKIISLTNKTIILRKYFVTPNFCVTYCQYDTEMNFDIVQKRRVPCRQNETFYCKFHKNFSFLIELNVTCNLMRKQFYSKNMNRKTASNTSFQSKTTPIS